MNTLQIAILACCIAIICLCVAILVGNDSGVSNDTDPNAAVDVSPIVDRLDEITSKLADIDMLQAKNEALSQRLAESQHMLTVARGVAGSLSSKLQELEKEQVPRDTNPIKTIDFVVNPIASKDGENSFIVQVKLLDGGGKLLGNPRVAILENSKGTMTFDSRETGSLNIGATVLSENLSAEQGNAPDASGAADF